MGAYFFASINAITKVLIIASIISTKESISKSLISIPPFMRFLKKKQVSMYQRIIKLPEVEFSSVEGVTAYRPGSSASILTCFDKLHNPSNKKN